MSTNEQLIHRIQAQLSASARQNLEAVVVPPFTIYINADSDSLWSNYAIPDEPAAGDVHDTLDTLCTAFREHGRQPRFEYIDEFTPALAPVLASYGFIEEMRAQLMICTPATYRPVESYMNVQMQYIAHDEPIGRFQDYMTVQQGAFGEDETVERVDATEAEQFRRRFATTQFFAAWLAGTNQRMMVSVACLLPAYDGITEIAGIATQQRYRRQGIAGALTAHAVEQAFAQGLTGVFLTAANADAGRVYERVGFHTIGTGLAYHLPGTCLGIQFLGAT